MKFLQEHLSSWRDSHSEALALTPGIEDRLTALEAKLADSGDVDHDWLKSVLAHYEEVLDTQTRVRDVRAQYRRAIDEDDFTLVSSLADDLEELQRELEEVYTVIDKDISDPTQLTVQNIVSLSIENISKEIESGRFGLAYHLARATPGVFPSANAIELVACNYVTSEQASVARLPDLAEKLIGEVQAALGDQPDQSLRRCHAALIASAALMPARVAPGGPVAELLQSLETYLKDTPSLWGLSQSVAKVSMKVSMMGVHLTSEMLYGDDSVERWAESVKRLQEKTNAWLEAEREATLKFQAATKVWQRILEDWENKDGRLISIGRMFALLMKPIDQIDMDQVNNIADHWRSDVQKNIDRIDREFRTSTQKIEGHARKKVISKIIEAVAFADEWRLLFEGRPDKRPGYLSEQVNELRNAVRVHAKGALDELDKIGSSENRIAGRAKRLIQRYVAPFENAGDTVSASKVTRSDLLHGYLLADSNVDFSGFEEIDDLEVSPEIVLRLVRQTRRQFKQGFKNAAIERARRYDFLVAEKTLDFAVRCKYLDDEDADEVRIMIGDERDQVEEELKKRIEKVSDDIDANYARNVLPKNIYDGLRGDITFIEEHLDIDESQSSNEILDDIDRVMKKHKGIAEKIIVQRLEKQIKKMRMQKNKMPPHSEGRIRDAIARGHFQIAEDYIERVERGEALPQSEMADRPFDRFFPNYVKEYDDFRKKSDDRFGEIQKIVKHRRHSGPIDASKLSADSARDGSRLVEAWSKLHVEKRTSEESLEELLELMSALGFPGRGQIKGHTSSKEGRMFRFESDVIVDRKITQLPDFGSRARDPRIRGSRARSVYNIVTIRDRGTHEAIIREAKEWTPEGRSPTLVIFLNVLDVDARRSLASEFSRGAHSPTIVLDEALLVFLATVPHRRLSAFFDCASPFAFVQPFDPDATEVPPEMFFGRERERRQILAMSGEMSHLVYGGRRLGKTVLLKSIEREYQDRASKGLVFLLDLKATGTGLGNKSPQAFWSHLGDLLRQHKIAKGKVSRYDSISEIIKNWLNQDYERRILILADEADDFLNADRGDLQGMDQRFRQRYRVLTQIKNLMDITERRFKVVFSGLHNVQRTARDPNTPFAHLGEPLEIGPMLPEKGGNEIENLIRGPLEALGYRFKSLDSVDSVIRIAAETNYYPALAQQLCKELLRHLREHGGASGVGEEGPPFDILPETVDHVFNSKETRERLRDLFKWTIVLDPRYEFLAYLIARQSFNNESARPDGVSIDDIRNVALKEWHSGFVSDDSYSTFEVLLEEMIGLGILREVEDGSSAVQTRRFAIRTHNLRILLGSDSEIEQKYAAAKSKAPPGFDPAQHRTTLEGNTLSSLTAGQVDQLLSARSGVSLVFGTHLSGLDQVSESISKSIEGMEDAPIPYEPPHIVNMDSLDELLRDLLPSRERIHIILVDARDNWNSRKIDETLDFIAGLEALNRIIRPVFLGGPKEAWGWLNDPRSGDRSKMKPREIWLSPCSKGFAHKWLIDREAGACDDLVKLDLRVDPPWPIVTALAAKPMSPSAEDKPPTIDKAICLALETYPGLISDILEVSQAEPALRVLESYSELESITESMTIDEISDMSEEELGGKISPEDVSKVINWASHLGVVHQDEKGYRLDSTYAAGIKAVFKK